MAGYKQSFEIMPEKEIEGQFNELLRVRRAEAATHSQKNKRFNRRDAERRARRLEAKLDAECFREVQEMVSRRKEELRTHFAPVDKADRRFKRRMAEQAKPAQASTKHETQQLLAAENAEIDRLVQKKLRATANQ